MARQSTSKCRHFWFTTEFNGEWVEGRMWRQIKNTMILTFAYFTCFCGKGWKSCWKKMLARCVVVGCSNTTNLQEVLRFMPYRFMERWSSWREETYKVMARFRESETYSDSRLRVRWSVLQRISNQMISLGAWIFRERKGFRWLSGLSKMNLE